VIVGDHTTREGSYVALTRAREKTQIYAANINDATADFDPVQTLADQMSQTEPDVPSIETPLAHENTITTDHTINHARPVRSFGAVEAPERDTGHGQPLIGAGLGAHAEHQYQPEPTDPRNLTQPRAVTDARALNGRDTERPEIHQVQELDEISDRGYRRTWPRTPNRERASLERNDAPEQDHGVGWER
jgi:hypothetical protein